MTDLLLPSSDLDPFTDAALVDPWDVYRQLRAAGPVVHLTRYDLWAVTRYDDVRAVLADWETFSSLAVGLNSTFNELAAPHVSTNILMSSPPDHDRLRGVLGADLSPRGLRERLEGFVVGRVDALVDELVDRGSFDAVQDLARPLVMGIIYDLNGLPESGRDRFFGWAADMFNALGPMNPRTEQGLRGVGEMFAWLESEAGRDQIRAGSWAASIYDGVERGDIPGAKAHELLSTYIAPAVDTTIQALGWTFQLLARHPDQWAAIRQDPALIPSAFREVVRVQPPVHQFGRRVERDTEIGGVPVPRGAHLMVSYASANRDERAWTDPDRFDIRRDNTGQLGFGHGVHACVGQGLARLEVHSVLRALSRRVVEVTAGESRPFVNNLVHGLDSLPVQVRTT